MMATSTSVPAVRFSRRKRMVFALAAVLLALAIPVVLLLGIDIYLHGKFARSAGFNVWGYRGPLAGRKQVDEYRVVVLGGSAAFGYGTQWDEAIPAVLERDLAGRRIGAYQRFSVVNLGYNNEGAYSFKFTLNDYRWLRYDLAILYEGYNDLMGDPQAPNLSVFRHESPVFRLTGYLPIFPVIFKEKAASMLTGGDPGALYDAARTGTEIKTTFRPGLATRTTAEVLQSAALVGQSLERQLGRVTAEPRHQIVDAASTGCKYPWQEYCRSIMDAVQFGLEHGSQLLVVTQPNEIGTTLRARHREQQREMANLLGRRFAGDPRVRYANLGEAIDLSDPILSYDRMHLTAPGNQRIAAALVQPVVEMAALRAAGQR
jgi:hypothetical protein